MSSNNTNSADFLVNKLVKIQSLSTRPDLNGKVALVTAYLPDKMRYLVKLSNPHPSIIVNALRFGTNIPPISLRRESISLASYSDRLKCKVFGVREMVTFVLTDANIRKELRNVCASLMQNLSNNNYYILFGIVVILSFSLYFIGFSKTLIVFSLLAIIPAVSLNEILAGSDFRTVIKKYPYNLKEIIIRCTGYKRITTTMAMGIFFVMMLFSISFLISPIAFQRSKSTKYGYPLDKMNGSYYSKTKSLSHNFSDKVSAALDLDSTTENTVEISGLKYTIGELYDFGFKDAIQRKDYGTSLPGVDTDDLTYQEIATPTVVDSIDPDDDYSYSHEDKPQKKKRIGLSTVLSSLALVRIVKDIGFTSNGKFDINHLVLNLKNMQPWRICLSIFMVFNILKSFI